MPSYTFKWSDTPELTKIDFVDDDLVWSEAISTMGVILRDMDPFSPSPITFDVEIWDSEGRQLGTVTICVCRLG